MYHYFGVYIDVIHHRHLLPFGKIKVMGKRKKDRVGLGHITTCVVVLCGRIVIICEQ